MDRINVNLGERAYDICFTDSFGMLAAEMKKINAPQKLLIVTDTNVERIYGREVLETLIGAGYDCSLYAFNAGEENKTINTITDICRASVENELDRKSMIVALGGGVVGDMAGFAAAIYMRGIDFVQIPTTLLSQSDSSVGGKTGIDFCNGKNILGAFHQPKLVYINVDTLRTLPDIQLVSGMGEVIKHGIICDREFYDFIKTNSVNIKSLDSDLLIKMAKRNCEIKASVVEQDERESGLRAILNFGHTIGHAVESALNFTKTHGECVGLGIAAVCRIANLRGFLSEEEQGDIESVLEDYGFEIKTKLPDCNIIYDFMNKDKKKTNGKINFVLPVKIGEVIRTSDVTNDEILEAIRYISL